MKKWKSEEEEEAFVFFWGHFHSSISSEEGLVYTYPFGGATTFHKDPSLVSSSTHKPFPLIVEGGKKFFQTLLQP